MEVAVIVALPKLRPVTVGWIAGVVWPAAMVTEASEIDTRAGSLLTSAMVVLAGAGPESVTGKGSVCPDSSSLRRAGRSGRN